MRCPNDDAELLTKTVSRDGLTITTATCPGCGGYWLDSFNANYLETDDIERSLQQGSSGKTMKPVCPVCQEFLSPYHGENIPSNVKAWRCPNGDGYFFPNAELFAFKKAQTAKLAYYKTWGIPLPSVASVLLVAIIAIASLGLINTYLQYQSRQTSVTQARDLMKFQQAFVAGHSVTIAVTTTAKVRAAVHIGDTMTAMKTTDQLTHTAFFTNLMTGTYQYYFTFLVVGGAEIRSDNYTFTIQP